MNKVIELNFLLTFFMINNPKLYLRAASSGRWGGYCKIAKKEDKSLLLQLLVFLISCPKMMLQLLRVTKQNL